MSICYIKISLYTLQALDTLPELSASSNDFMDNACGSSNKTSSCDSERMKGEQKALWKVKGKQIVDEDLAPSAIVGRSSLPCRIQKLKETSFSLFVSNIQEEMSKVEPEAMFCRAGKILDVFIPMEKHSRRKRGFAFVRFGTFHEAEKAVETARGRSWGGRKIQAQLSRIQIQRRKTLSSKRYQQKCLKHADPEASFFC